MPNFDSGSTMSYPLALRININKKQTNKQTNRTSVLCLPWCWLALPSFLGPIAYHFILYHYYSKPIAFLSWLSYFGSIKPDITARFFGYLYRVYFQFFIYILKVCFLRLSNKTKCLSSFIVRKLINSHLDIFYFLFYLASGNKTWQE